jgi:hypothetical protein
VDGPPVDGAPRPLATASVAQTAPAPDDVAASTAPEEPRTFDLIRVLTAANSYVDVRSAVRVGSSGVEYGNWRIAPDGSIDASPWVNHEAFGQAVLGQEAAASASKKRAAQLPYRIRDLQTPVLRTDGREAAPTAEPDFADSLIATVDGVLETPDRGAVSGRFFTYETVEAMFVPTEEKQERWAIVISEGLLSPAGPWRAATRADMDGDGRSDLAFVAQGVDGCDRSRCPLFWLTLLLTDTRVAPPFEEALFFDTGNVAAFFAPCSSGTDDFDLSPRLRWRARIARQGLEVSAACGRCRGEWHFSQLDGGRFERTSAP